MTDPSNGIADALAQALLPHYRLEQTLGSGATATVYRATDLKHGRPVALKVLRREMLDAEGLQRFDDEIRLAARLTHPHIVPVLDSGRAGHAPFYVMPLIEGESLRERLERERQLPLGVALGLVFEVADALDYAHAAGIVHRDIKPENILLLRDHALVADFGIARALTVAAGDRRTSVGMVLGTPAYMSPEQAAGELEVDGRSDLYALATMLFELLAGRLPLEAPTVQGLLVKRLTQEPPRLSTLVPDLPPAVDAAIAAALERDAARRPASALAFVRAIDGRSTPTAGVATVGYATVRGTGAAAPTSPSVAVLPFANLSAGGDDEFLSDGVTEEIMGALSRLRSIRVAARTSSFAFKERRSDVREIARQLGVGHVLDGSVRRAGARVRVSAQLVDATTGFEIWSDRFDRPLDDAFAIQDEVAQAIAAALSATLLSGGGALARDRVRGEAYEAYLRARFALNQRTERTLIAAAADFRLAISLEPSLAVAHAGLAEAQLLLGVYGAVAPATALPAARAAAEQALAVDPALGVAHAVLGSVRALYDRDWLAAEDAFRRALAIDPRHPTVSQWHAMHCLLPQGRFDEARGAVARARQLDPLASVLAASEAVVLHFAGDLDAAVAVLRDTLGRDPTFGLAHFFLGAALRDAGALDAAEAAYRDAIVLASRSPEMLCGLGVVLARRGDERGARALLGELRAAASSRYVAPTLFVQLYAALGDLDAADVALGEARALHDPELGFLGVRPSYRALHGRPAFEALRLELRR